MKKTKTISLILVSAALASCQREFVPAQANRNNNIDSTLTDDPEYQQLTSSFPCGNCCSYYSNGYTQNYQQLWSYSFSPIGNINPFPVKQFYYYHDYKRKLILQNGARTIVRSGWGNTAMRTTAVS